MVSSCFVVPTERVLRPDAINYIEDLERINQKFSLEIPFILIDDSTAISENLKILRNAKTKRTPVLHLDPDSQKKILSPILARLNITNYFYNDCVSYGTVLNKIFIFTVLFGFNAFHRRDSDTSLILNPEHRISQLEHELAKLGGKLADVFPDLESTYNNDEIFMVGGNYIGKPNVNLTEIAEYDPRIAKNIMRHIGVGPRFVEPIYNVHYSNFDKIDLADVVLTEPSKCFPLSQSDPTYPECGNYSMYKIFMEIPASPVRNGFGEDYIHSEILFNLNFPVVQHSESVYHWFSEIQSLESKVVYWYRLAQHLDSVTIRKHVLECYKKIHTENEVDISNKIFLKAIKLTVDSIGNFEEERRNTMNEFISTLSKIEIMQYSHVAERLRPNSEKILSDSVTGYIEYAGLLAKWPDLISECSNQKLNISHYMI